MAILLIGSTGSGKSTLGNFLIDPSEKHRFINPSFSTAKDNKPHTQFVVAKQAQWQHEHQNMFVTIVDTPGMPESDEEKLQHSVNIIEELSKVGIVQACLFVVKFTSKINAEYRDTVAYYSKLLPTLFERNTAIVMTDFARDERSVALREAQGIDVERVKQGAVNEIMASGTMMYSPRVFAIDCMPIEANEIEASIQEREYLLDYICHMKPFTLKSLSVHKPPHIRQQDDRKIEHLKGEIAGYNHRLKYGDQTKQDKEDLEYFMSEKRKKIIKLSEDTMTIDEAIMRLKDKI